MVNAYSIYDCPINNIGNTVHCVDELCSCGCECKCVCLFCDRPVQGVLCLPDIENGWMDSGLSCGDLIVLVSCLHLSRVKDRQFFRVIFLPDIQIASHKLMSLKQNLVPPCLKMRKGFPN